MSAVKQKKAIPVGVSFRPDLLSLAKRKAKEEGRSLSNYIQRLIEQDLNKSQVAA